MGLQEKRQHDGNFDSDSNSKKRVNAGIPVRAPLKEIFTKVSEKKEGGGHDDQEDCSNSSTTPRGQDSRIPVQFTCPPAPKKRKASLKCHRYTVKEFFKPPDLESLFIRHVEKEVN